LVEHGDVRHTKKLGTPVLQKQIARHDAEDRERPRRPEFGWEGMVWQGTPPVVLSQVLKVGNFRA